MATPPPTPTTDGVESVPQPERPIEPDADGQDAAAQDVEAECVARDHGARLVVTDLGERRFRVDVELDNMGLPAGTFHEVLDAATEIPVATFAADPKPLDPSPTLVVEDITRENTAAGMVVTVADGVQTEVFAHVNAEVEMAQWAGGRCNRFWSFTNVRTDPVTVG